jgi:hypothetical protein
MRARSNTISIDRAAVRPKQSLALCVQNTGYEVSLERGKIYRVVKDDEADELGQLRVVDESGEDYLFPKFFFVPISVSAALRKKILRAV